MIKSDGQLLFNFLGLAIVPIVALGIISWQIIPQSVQVDPGAS